MNRLLKPHVVLDTNFVLEWLVFKDIRTQQLANAIENKFLQWIGTPAMQEELSRVLLRESLQAWKPDTEKIWNTWAQFCHRVTQAIEPAPRHMYCTDADDQKFIDLALNQAQWLISRDRAILKLAGRARALGLTIVTAERWRPAQPPVSV
jgi:putative PIN family toxin of toxin-antitoxin system